MTRGTCTLSAIGLFSDLTSRDFEALDKCCHWQTYGAGQQILSRSDLTTDVFFIVSGDVRVAACSLDGKEVAFRDLGAGTTFGELSAMDGAPRSADVVALSDAVVPSMAAEAFMDVLRTHPEVSAKLLRQLAGLTRKLSDRVYEFSVLAVKNRVHAELLRLAREHDNGDNMATVSPAPTHAEIASRVSTHREAVTRELNALDKGGMIERRKGALIVPDVARLAALVADVGEVSE